MSKGSGSSKSGASRGGFGGIMPTVIGTPNEDVKQAVLEAFDEVANEFPGLRDFVKTIDFNSGSGATDYSVFDRSIKFNGAQARMSKKDFDAEADRDSESLGALKGGVKALTKHEIGHALDDAVKVSIKKQYAPTSKRRDKVREQQEQDRLGEYQDAKRRLRDRVGSPSRYGDKNSSEWVAERFLYETQNKGAKPLHDLLKDFL